MNSGYGGAIEKLIAHNPPNLYGRLDLFWDY